MRVTIALTHFSPTLNVSENLGRMIALISNAKENDIVVMPEGCLSGYDENLSFLDSTVAFHIESSFEQLQSIVDERNIHLLFGSCIFERGSWYNAGIYMAPHRKRHTYKKVNLAYQERGMLQPGSELSCFELHLGDSSILASIQLCREIRFPEQWKALAQEGSQITFYLTNVTNSDNLSVWNAHLISRAAENQRFVVSSNISHPEQGCSSMIVSPKGKIIKKLQDDVESIERITIDLNENSNWYVNQTRRDVVNIVTS
ncbi:carbon-nitrogen hydrolase family protein [Alkalihalobacillus sp. CinArs1]|uniref:carbon-nitrogen hydrolase family protein n=1 Tax=Alkalihalobacillus sp. CinArs1 TaxID=2995314 RepID=UPI0022DD5313|nr:carbon-nitrogen hydrolase family protein [Alkalihalobacillus sp. CinArs1]